MLDYSLFITAFLTGLLGSTHCLGMCGGLSAALTFALPADKRKGLPLLSYLISYNAGRILTYCLLGLFVGLLSAQTQNWIPIIWPRILAGIFMIMLGLYMAKLWLGLQQIEKLGQNLWRHLQPLQKKLFPIDNIGKALMAGGLWGMLPCGMVYAALILALSGQSTLSGIGAMFAFGLGTLPLMLVSGAFAAHLRAVLQKRHVQLLSGLLVVLFGMWTLYAAIQPHHHRAHAESSLNNENKMPPDHEHMHHHH